MMHNELLGIVQLQRPMAPAPVNWEVRDVLKAAARQIAGYLAVRQAVEKLVEARQFDSFNRMSAFVAHDLKNLVAQLSLLTRNAARHRDNPDFQRDMLSTVQNVLERMQGLLLQLRVGDRPVEQAAPVPLGPILLAAIHAKHGLRPEPIVNIDAILNDAQVIAHADRLQRVIGHLIQNAAEATSSGGSVTVRARPDGEYALIEVEDSGRGMSREFVETRLFKPFVSTKAHGMGIGAFESREYIRDLGGTLTIRSVEGVGSTFTIRLPLQRASAAVH